MKNPICCTGVQAWQWVLVHELLILFFFLIHDSVLGYEAFSKLLISCLQGRSSRWIKAFGPNFSLLSNVVARCLHGCTVLLIYASWLYYWACSEHASFLHFVLIFLGLLLSCGVKERFSQYASISIQVMLLPGSQQLSSNHKPTVNNEKGCKKHWPFCMNCRQKHHMELCLKLFKRTCG